MDSRQPKQVHETEINAAMWTPRNSLPDEEVLELKIIRRFEYTWKKHFHVCPHLIIFFLSICFWILLETGHSGLHGPLIQISKPLMLCSYLEARKWACTSSFNFHYGNNYILGKKSNLEEWIETPECSLMCSSLSFPTANFSCGQNKLFLCCKCRILVLRSVAVSMT